MKFQKKVPPKFRRKNLKHAADVGASEPKKKLEKKEACDQNWLMVL